MERIGAIYLGEAEAPGVHDQLQQTVKELSPEREMAPELWRDMAGASFQAHPSKGTFCPGLD